MATQVKEKKVMEYEEAPSGFVTLYNYKEPFMKYQKGYGFQGVLLFDGESDKIQCHMCGEWFGVLGNHLAKEHGMKVKAYKEEVGLLNSTALISEKVRAKLIATGLKKRIRNLKNQKGVVRSKETRDKIRKTLMENRREKQNQHGTCPEQLIERLIKEYQKLNHTPTERSLSFKESLINTYGTYRNACKIAGIPEPQTNEDTLKKGRQTIANRRLVRIENMKNEIFNFYDKEGMIPLDIELNIDNQKTAKSLRKYELAKIHKDIIIRHGKFTAAATGFSFSKDELLLFLRNFEKYHGRRPSYSDARRRLIPHLSRYSYHFGSWKGALKQAFN